MDVVKFGVREKEEGGSDPKNWSQFGKLARKEIGKRCGLESRLVSLRNW